MPLSMRLDQKLEKELLYFSRIMHLTKTELIRSAIISFLEMLRKESRNPYEIYHSISSKIEGSSYKDLSREYKKILSSKLTAYFTKKRHCHPLSTFSTPVFH
jgi:hypothetical protein